MGPLPRLAALLQALFALSCALLIARVVGGGVTSGPVLALVAALLALGLVAGWSAVLLWRGHRAGAVVTIAMQALLLPRLITTPLTWVLSMPLTAAVGLGPGGVPVGKLWWRPAISLTLDSNMGTTWVGVNLVALLAIVGAAQVLRRGTDA